MSIRNHLNIKRKSALTSMLMDLKKTLAGMDNVDCRLAIEKVISFMSSTSVYVSKEQRNLIIGFIKKAENSTTNSKELIKKECDNIMKVLKNTYIKPTGRECAIQDIDEKIDNVYEKLTVNNNRICELRKAQADVLGKDKNLWKRYQSEITRKMSENRLYEQSFDTLLKKKESLGIVTEVENTKVVNQIIDSGDMFIDLDTSTETIRNNELKSQEVIAENDKLQNAIFDSTSQSLDDEYNAALEAAAARTLEAKNSTEIQPESSLKLTESK